MMPFAGRNTLNPMLSLWELLLSFNALANAEINSALGSTLHHLLKQAGYCFLYFGKVSEKRSLSLLFHSSICLTWHTLPQVGGHFLVHGMKS